MAENVSRSAIYVLFSDCGQHIRKWSGEPFEGSQVFRADAEYICRCGLRVEPHRCRETLGEF